MTHYVRMGAILKLVLIFLGIAFVWWGMGTVMAMAEAQLGAPIAIGLPVIIVGIVAVVFFPVIMTMVWGKDNPMLT